MNSRTIFNNKKRRNQFIFYTSIVILPFIQFLIMYVGVNFRSILFVFQKYNEYEAEYATKFSYFGENIAEAWNNLFGNNVNLTYAWKNTLISYSVGLLMTFINIFICFFIYKKVLFAGWFKVVFYIPSIVNGFVTIFAFRYFVERGLPRIFPNNPIFTESGGLIANANTAFWALTIYTIWSGLGGGLILTIGQMSRTSVSVLEAAKIDGVNIFQEFIHVVWPVLYPVVTIGLYTGVTGIFLAGPPTFAFFGESADPQLYTFGYYMFTLVVGNKSSAAAYPISATMGIMFTCVAAPMVFALKHWFETHDPNN